VEDVCAENTRECTGRAVGIPRDDTPLLNGDNAQDLRDQFAVSSPPVRSKAPIEIGDVSLWTQGGHSRARRNIRWRGPFIAQTGGGIRPDQLQCGRRLPEFSFERRQG
jgi:hypothetical protein